MRFIIGFLISIGLLIFVFVLIFRGGDNGETVKPIQLIDYANTSVAMQFTEEGPVLANVTHREVRITVTNQEASIELFAGYQNQLLDSRTYRNNSAAYADFLRALQLAGYTLGNNSKAMADERGYCPSGRRYVQGIIDGGQSIQRYWSASCNGVGTFRGKSSVVRTLFIGQVPDYDKIVGTQL